MRIANFWTVLNWALLGLNVLTEAAVFWLAASRGYFRRLAMLPLYALFCLSVDLAGTCIAILTRPDKVAGTLWTSRLYSDFYWMVQLVAGGLVLLLALQIVTAILPPWDRLITILAILTFSGLAIAYMKLIPGDIWHLITALTVADCIALLALPIIAVVAPSEWPDGLTWVVAGLIASASLQTACSAAAAHFKTLAGVFNLGIPFAALVGMACFLAGVYGQGKDIQSPLAA